MSFLIFAAPIIFIIIIVIFAVVMLSDSKSYKKNLSNSKQMELERAREDALKALREMRRIKEEAPTSSVDTYTHTPESKSLHQQKTLVQQENLEKQKSVARENSLEKRHEAQKEKTLREQKTITREQSLARSSVEKEVVNKYQDYYNKNYNKSVNKFKQQAQLRPTSPKQQPKLVFSKENLVRGVIAKEYLNRKAGRRL